MKSFTKKSLSLLALSFTGAVACGAFVGCGSDDSTDNPGTDAGKDATATDASHTDAAPGTDSGPGSDSGPSDAGSDAGDSSPGGAVTTRTANVEITQTKASQFYIKSAAATFTQTTYTGAPECVATTVNSSCTYTVCTPPAATDAGLDAGFDASDADAGQYVFPNAGPITITGFSGTTLLGAAETVTFTPSSTNGLYSVTTPANGFDTTTEYFKTGDTLAFAAATGSSAFAGTFSTSLPAPIDVTVSAPTIPQNGTTVTISRGTPLAVTWTAGAQGTSIVATLMEDNTSTGVTKTVACTFDAFTETTDTVPSTNAIGNFDIVDGTTIKGNISVLPVSKKTTTAANAGGSASGTDAWNITTSATATGASGQFTTN